MSNCAACNDKLLGNDYMKCGRCKEAYHYLCLNFSPEEVTSITEDIRRSWMCPNCLNKQPKGDNSNALVRPSTPTGLAEVTFNVTKRKVQTKPETLSTCKMMDPSDFVTRSDLQLTIREEIRSAMREFAGVMNSTLNAKLSEINETLGELKESVSFLNDQFETIKSKVDINTSMVNKLKIENDSLRSEIGFLAGRVRLMDQMSRSTNLELQRVPERKAENVITIVKQLGNVVNCPLNDCDITYCSRTAKSNPDSSRPRSILVKLSTPRLRDSLLAAVIKYNKKHANDEKLNSSVLGLDDKKVPVYVVENLSAENKHLHAAARLRAKQLSYKYVWVRSGRVYMRKSDTSEAVFVRNVDVLNSLK
ncbi:hypothetical protein ABMA27_010071 [Loxostege sticticalis]|uniref:PHD-type domain-containing protein n=1 Tax=Loxostege sticticalis TaxID=481309 RepID=A0ABR3H4W2_LOXSC